jgi:hypothetical protein
VLFEGTPRALVIALGVLGLVYKIQIKLTLVNRKDSPCFHEKKISPHQTYTKSLIQLKGIADQRRLKQRRTVLLIT